MTRVAVPFRFAGLFVFPLPLVSSVSTATAAETHDRERIEDGAGESLRSILRSSFLT